jgi:serine/threonine-protein phosphatase PGAM5
VIEAPELIDHIHYVPPASDTTSSWMAFFDGDSESEAAAGQFRGEP